MVIYSTLQNFFSQLWNDGQISPLILLQNCHGNDKLAVRQPSHVNVVKFLFDPHASLQGYPYRVLKIISVQIKGYPT